MIRMMRWMTKKSLTTSERREGGLGAAAYPQPPLILATPHSALNLCGLFPEVFNLGTPLIFRRLGGSVF